MNEKHSFEFDFTEFARTSSATMDGRELRGVKSVSVEMSPQGRCELVLRLLPKRVFMRMNGVDVFTVFENELGREDKREETPA